MKTHIKNKKIFIICICVLIISNSLSACSSLTLSACDTLFAVKYDGEHIDLYTVAVNNIFGINGYTNNGEISYQPEVSVIETDKYGRTLFFYNESYMSGNEYAMAFVIMQMSVDGYAYYYQDVCYSPFFDDTTDSWHGTEGGDDYIKALELAGDSIDELKERNDWNKDLDSSKFTKSKFCDEKPEGDIDVSDTALSKAVYTYAKEHGYQGSDTSMVRGYEYCNADADGKELYYVYCMTMDTDENSEKIFGYYNYAVIIDPEKSISQNAILEVNDPFTYYEQIRELKKNNNWKY